MDIVKLRNKRIEKEQQRKRRALIEWLIKTDDGSKPETTNWLLEQLKKMRV